MSTQIIFTTTGTNNWTVPSDWNSASNTIEVIGAGGSGSNGVNGTRNGAGGGGGGYGKIANQTLTPGASISYTIATGGSSGDTFFNAASLAAASVGSPAGGNGVTTAPGTGATGKGTTTYKGGDGVYSNTGNPSNNGGGGAAGPNGNGQLAGTGGVGYGGAGDNGIGGAGAAPNTGLPGSNGTEYGAVGSGGGGAGVANSNLPTNGGLYGAAGGGGGSSGFPYFNQAGGTGTQGLIVITYSATGSRYWVGGTGTWDASTTTHWSATSGGAGGASVPTTTNSVFFDSNSGGGSVTITATQSVINLDATGFAGEIIQSSALTTSGNLTYSVSIPSYFNSTATLNIGGDLQIGPTNSGMKINGTTTITGSVNFVNGSILGTSPMSIGNNLFIGGGFGNGYTGTITFTSTSSGKTITTNGIQITSPVVFNGVGGVWSLQDTLSIGGPQPLTITNGTLTTNNHTISTKYISNAGTINAGSSLLDCYQSGGTNWTNTGTFNAGTSTIQLRDYLGGSSTITFAGGNSTYYNLYLTGTGTGAFIIQGNNTFNDFKCDTPPHTIQFTAGTTQTLNTFTVNGTAGNLMTLQSTSAGNPWYLVKNPAGVVSCDYLSLQDSHVS